MKVTTRELGNREVELIIEVDDDRVEHAMRGAARRYAREMKIPGFRPGKAPYRVVAQRVGQEQLLKDALDVIGPQLYQEAVEEVGIEPYELNPLEIANYDPLTLTAILPLMPKVELGDYYSIHVDPPTVEVSEAEIDEVLREYQEENAQLVPVDRGAELGDQVILDLRIEADGTVVYDRQNVSFMLSPGGFTGVPDSFFKEIVGMRPGGERELSLAYPEDFGDEDLAGAAATFTVALHEVKERELPDLNDELAQTVGEFNTLEELRQQTRETLMSRAEVEADQELAETVLTQVMDMATVEYADVALDDEIDQLINRLEAQLSDRGLTLDNYLVMEGLTRDQLREHQRPDAEQRLERSVVLSEVVDREGIEVGDEEIDEEIERVAAMYGSNAAQARMSLSSEDSRRSIGSRLLAQKAIDRLVEIATREDSPEETGEGELVSGESDVTAADPATEAESGT